MGRIIRHSDWHYGIGDASLDGMTYRFCKDYTTINIGLQVDWGICKGETVITLNFGFWSLEVVMS